MTLLWSAATAGQSLGDVAQQEEARRKQITTKSKAYTNADLPPPEKARAETRQILVAAVKEVAATPTATTPVAAEQVVDKHLRPAVQSIGNQVQHLRNDIRRYLDACYQRYTRSSGILFPLDYGWGRLSAYAWQDTWSLSSSIDNSTTAYCRGLWSDIESNSQTIRSSLRDVVDIGRRAGVLPGTMRNLYDEYQVAAWVDR